jgi:hypothetical protein
MQTLLQEPMGVPQITAAVILGVLWLVATILIGRWIVKRLGALRTVFSVMAKGQTADAESVRAALEQLGPEMNRKAVTPELAKNMRANLARKLRIPAEMISSYTVRGRLSVHGVSPETIDVVEQVLRGGEEQRYGYTPPAASEITVVDVWKASRELDERLRKR